MKALKLICLLFGTVAVVSCNSNNTIKTEVAVNTIAQVSIEGMTCEAGCAKTIEQAITEMQGVAKCEVDFEKKKALIDFDSTLTNKGAIISSIQSINDGQYQANVESVSGIKH